MASATAPSRARPPPPPPPPGPPPPPPGPQRRGTLTPAPAPLHPCSPCSDLVLLTSPEAAADAAAPLLAAGRPSAAALRGLLDCHFAPAGR
jgi:hypothetical protein